MVEKSAKPIRLKTEEKRAQKRDMMLDEAARQINDFGAGAVNLNAVAKAAGLSRNALYYYISDRSDLAFLCFQQSCETMAEDLALAVETSSEPHEQLEAFIQSTLSPNGPPVAVLGEHDFLPEPHRTVIETATVEITRKIECIIKAGINTGSFRSINPSIAAHCLIGMINWVRLSARWLGEPSNREYRLDLARGIRNIFFHGWASETSAKPRSVIDVNLLTAKHYNAFDRDESADEKKSQLLAIASQLFNQHGIEATALTDIATAVGATKGVLYHYFENKLDLVVQCYERAFSIYGLFIEQALLHGANGFEQSFILQHLNCQAQVGSLSPMMLQSGLESLPKRHRAIFIESSRNIWAMTQKMLRDGIEDGSCNECDVEILTQVSVGNFSWLSKMPAVIQSQSPTTVADEICNSICWGIVKRPQLQSIVD